MARWPFTKPEGFPVALLPQTLTEQYRELEAVQVLDHQAHRFGFSLSEPADLLIAVSSTIADVRNWHRAGYLAGLLLNAPVPDPIKQVERLYFGSQYVSVPYTGLPYYVEFWPHYWITDYRISVWAKIASNITIPVAPENETGIIWFGNGNGNSNEFTFFGDLIRFP